MRSLAGGVEILTALTLLRSQQKNLQIIPCSNRSILFVWTNSLLFALLCAPASILLVSGVCFTLKNRVCPGLVLKKGRRMLFQKLPLDDMGGSVSAV